MVSLYLVLAVLDFDCSSVIGLRNLPAFGWRAIVEAGGMRLLEMALYKRYLSGMSLLADQSRVTVMPGVRLLVAIRRIVAHRYGITFGKGVHRSEGIACTWLCAMSIVAPGRDHTQAVRAYLRCWALISTCGVWCPCGARRLPGHTSVPTLAQTCMCDCFIPEGVFFHRLSFTVPNPAVKKWGRFWERNVVLVDLDCTSVRALALVRREVYRVVGALGQGLGRDKRRR